MLLWAVTMASRGRLKNLVVLPKRLVTLDHQSPHCCNIAGAKGFGSVERSLVFCHHMKSASVDHVRKAGCVCLQSPIIEIPK